MSRRITSKSIPATPSFAAWQRAADRLLTLETALAHSRRAVPQCPKFAELQTSATEVRLIADALFRVAFAEAKLAHDKRYPVERLDHPAELVQL
jgi:hypothetical protein